MKKLTTTVALLLAIWPWPGHAETQWCTGTVSSVWVDAASNVYFVGSWRGDHTMACNLNEARAGVAPKTCSAWFVALQSAVARRSTVIVQYIEAPACAALPTYGAAPTPNYIMNVD